MSLARWILLGVALVYWVGIFILTHLPGDRLPRVHLASDKIAHVAAFAVLGGLLLGSLWLIWPRRRLLAGWAFAVGLLYAAVDEWTQVLAGRSCELVDWLADAVGLGAAVMLMCAGRWLWEHLWRPRRLPSEAEYEAEAA